MVEKTSPAETTLRGAMAAHRAGRWEEADSLYRQAIAAEPEHGRALRLRGILRRDLGDLDLSATLLRKAAEVSPADPEPVAELALSYLAAGFLRMAESALRQALQRNARHAKSLANLAALLQYRGRLTEAVDLNRRLLAVTPDDSEVWANLATTLTEAGHGEEALAACDRALSTAPDDPTLLATRGAVLVSLGRNEESIAPLRDAIALAPDDDMAMINLGVAYERLGQTTEAARLMQAATAANPDNARATADLVNLLSREGAWVESLAIADRFLERHPAERLVLAARTVALRDSGAREQAAAIVDHERLISVQMVTAPRGAKGWSDDLARAILEHPTLVDSPLGKSTRAGRQTGELDPEPGSPLAQLLEQVDAAIREHAAGIARAIPDHPQVAFGSAQWTLRVWGTVLQSGGYQLPHMHPLGWISGVFYPQIPPGMKRDDRTAGALEFGTLPNRIVAGIAPETRLIEPETGMLVLFPSYFYHGTRPFQAAEPRVSIAFDAVPRR